MSVHYKFKSNLDHDTVTFDGLNISVADLKKSIMHQKKIGKSSDFDLQITNAQTKEVYDNDEMLVPKNTSVIVARVPVQGGSKKNWSDKPDLPLPIDDDDLGRIRYDRIAKSADLVNANTSEEDKVKAMITQSSQEYDPSKYVKSRSMTGPLPPTYTCFRCGKTGHWIKNCPTNNPDIKRSTGIPRSFMVPVDGPEHKGALLTSSGDYAVPLIDHQAYKEVKKEKPPFVPQDEPVKEPEPEIPEELLCMVCKDLLQDAVLIPCCGNSFCDECVRTVLLESDNHECPVCNETEVSPNTLIPNRFLRTAVLNYKNETGYTHHAKRAATLAKSSPPSERVNSPQPSPDSTFESQSNADTTTADSKVQESRDNKLLTLEVKKGDSGKVAGVDKAEEDGSLAVGGRTPENVTSKATTEDESDIQPGTPLADEPIDHHLPIQAIGQEHYPSDRHQSGQKHSRSHRDERKRRYSGESREPQPIHTIGTVTNIRKFFSQRPGPFRDNFSNQRTRSDTRSDNYSNDREDYRRRYDDRYGDRESRRNQDYDRPRNTRYHQRNAQDYAEHEHPEYNIPPSREEDSSHHRQERYRSPPRQVLIPPPVPTTIYPPPVLPAIPPPHLLAAPPVFPPQPPPPGASPINTTQPPPPGVGPLLPLPADAGAVFKSRPYENEDPLKDVANQKERSIDDRMEEFQRKLNKRDRKYARDRASHSRSRSRSLSRSRSFTSSKSWSRSVSRSSTRTSRSRSRTPFSSPSRSFSPSRSRSWSKKRSYSRSRSRTRGRSRSHSRSRIESRVRRRVVSRDRSRSPRHRQRSRSFSPRHYRESSRRSREHSSKHGYNQPLDQFSVGAAYHSQFGPPQAVLPIPAMRQSAFPHHLPSSHQPIQSVHSRPVDQYPVERAVSKYPSYGDQYPGYEGYALKYDDQRYERERVSEHRSSRYDKRPEYQRHEEEVGHRIPGWVGDRPRDYKPRYRSSRDQFKEIRELPQIPESEMRAIQSKGVSLEEPVKRKEEKVSSKHKKHHHHHKSKDAKKQEKSNSGEKILDSTKSYVEPDENMEKEQASWSEEEQKSVKTTEKSKEKKHKHKKHKVADHLAKKKKSKKQKGDGAPSTDSDLPVKAKIKKKKVKTKIIETKIEDVPPIEEGTADLSNEPAEPQEEITDVVEENISKAEEVEDKPVEQTDVLDIFAEDSADDGNEQVDAKTNVTEDADVSSVAVEDTITEGANVDEDNAESGQSGDEEAAEESFEDESVLKVDMPGISKWEREESEEEEESSSPLLQHTESAAEKDEKVSSDIISRAENALISKQFKPRIEEKAKGDSKHSSDNSTPERSPARHKDAPELKSVVTKEPIKPDTLKVTISNSKKDKRSVYSRKEDSRKLHKNESPPPKRERSSRYREEPSRHRSVAVYPAREEGRARSHRGIGDRRPSPPRDTVTKVSRETVSKSSREHKESSRRDTGLDLQERDNQRREERRRRFETSSKISYDTSGKSRTIEISHQQSKRTGDREPVRSSTKRSRSRSYESASSYNTSKKKNEHKLHKPAESRHRSNTDKVKSEKHEPVRMKHSPIKPPDTSSVHVKPVKRDFEDELKFEPDYDDFSDAEEKSQESKPKRKASSPEDNRKGAKITKISKSDTIVKRGDRPSIASSATSSDASESDSSDSDEPRKGKNSESDHKQKHKKSKHKKHKKHKHKHKKKKSHKSKRE